MMFPPVVNTSTDKSTSPNAMQFRAYLPRFMHKILEADPSDGLVWVSKWYIYDAFHWFILRLADISAFAYIIPTLPTDISTLL